MKFLWPWLASLLSGILLALCYAPVNWGGLAWVALVPLVAALWFSERWPRHNDWRIFLLGFLTGLGYFLGSLQWLITVTGLGWFALCLYLALYPATWSIFVAGVVRPRDDAADPGAVWLKSGRNLAVAALAAAAWTGLEWLRGIIFTGFGWNGLGVALHDNLALIQICDITGVGGLSFLVVMVNVMIVLTAKRLSVELKRRNKLRPHYDFSLTVALVAVVFSYGVRHLFAPPPASEPLSVAAVQANVPIDEKRDPAAEIAILDLHTRLTETILPTKPDLLIWPEAATPRPLFNDQRSWDAVRALAEKHDGDFLLGTVHLDERMGDFNSAFLLTDHGRDAQPYHKMHLVPFGEYVPLRESFPFFAWVVGDLVPDDFDFGREATVWEMAARPIKIGPLICFEDTLGNLARQFALKGAQIFVTVTNDAWFLRSAGAQQHLQNALFRTVETKLPMVRCANTGMTCVIDRFGRIAFQLDPFVEGVLRAEVSVPSQPAPTFYARYGELFSQICLGAAVLAAGTRILRRKS